MKDFWFQHDKNADGDAKIVRLLMKMGNEGYGLYWRLVERLYREGGKIPADYDVIAYGMGTHREAIASIVEAFDLFYVIEGQVGSRSVDRRLGEIQEKSEKGRIFAQRRWGPNGGPMATHAGPNAIRQDKTRQDKKTPAAGFEDFWKAYPKKKAKADAARAWAKVADEPGILNAVLTAIKNQAASPDWLKDGGQYIPYPASWLNARRWEDEGSSPRSEDDELEAASKAFLREVGGA